MERESILMYRSTWEMLQDIKNESHDNYELAMNMYLNYAFDGDEPELDKVPLTIKLFWKAAKPLIDANNKNYINGCKGGAPSESMKGNQNARKKEKQTQNKPKTNRNQTQNKGNVNDNANVNANDKDNVNDNVNDNENVNVNDNKEKCPFVDEEGIITNWDKFQEWKSRHPNWKGDDD